MQYRNKALLFKTLLCVLTISYPLLAHSQTNVFEGQYLIRRASNSPTNLRSLRKSGNIELVSNNKNTRAVSTKKVIPFNSAQAEADCNLLKQEHPEIELCEPNYEVFVETTQDSDLSLGSDELSLWGIADSQAVEAWDAYPSRGKDVVVAVLDTGVDYLHPDLAANIWTNSLEIPGNGIDDDSNGFVDDVHGYDFANNDSSPMDDHGHGTHVAGTIGAEANGSGVVGIAPWVKLMPLKFLNAGGGGSIFDAIYAIRYAQENGADIINGSFGGPGESTFLGQAIEAYLQSGGAFVAAAGNSGLNNDLYPHYPSNYPHQRMISVAAHDTYGEYAFFSNYGSNVTLSAPGVAIISTLPGGGVGALSGTSMAAPHVAGALAAVYSENLDAGIDAAISRLVNGVATLSDPTSDKYTRTGGKLNLLRALSGEVNGGNPVAEGVLVKSFTSYTAYFKRAKRLARGGVFHATFQTISGKAQEPFTAILTFQLPKAEPVSCTFNLTSGLEGSLSITGKFKAKGLLRSAKSLILGTPVDFGSGKSLRVKSRKRKVSNTRSTGKVSAALTQTCSAIAESIQIAE